jgi:hypothetical protein
LLSINTDEPQNCIIDNDFETPLHLWSDDSKLLLMMEEGKLEDEGFGESESRTPLVNWTHPAYRQKSEEYDENSKTPLSHGAVWPAGMSKVQPLAPLDLGPGWYQLDKLIGSESLVGPAARSVYEDALAAGHAGEAEATPKQKRD